MGLPYYDYFVPMDSTDPYEIIVVIFMVVLGATGLFANRLHIPFLHRSGGLMAYSKFAADAASGGMKIPSKWGMALLYFPSCLLSVYFFVQQQREKDSLPLSSLLALLHFGKRTLECLLLHKFSGDMPLLSSVCILGLYLIPSSSVCVLGSKQQEPNNLLTTIGLVLFVVGSIGNFYHHYLLARLRTTGSGGAKSYKVPTGGWFDYAAAPHYFFELVAWLGMALVGQHTGLLLVVACMTAYLMDRAEGQSEWNRKKLEDYPTDRKHMIPFVY